MKTYKAEGDKVFRGEILPTGTIAWFAVCTVADVVEDKEGAAKTIADALEFHLQAIHTTAQNPPKTATH